MDAACGIFGIVRVELHQLRTRPVSNNGRMMAGDAALGAFVARSPASRAVTGQTALLKAGRGAILFQTRNCSVRAGDDVF
jgi:hypothetical protein